MGEGAENSVDVAEILDLQMENRDLPKHLIAPIMG